MHPSTNLGCTNLPHKIWVIYSHTIFHPLLEQVLTGICDKNDPQPML